MTCFTAPSVASLCVALLPALVGCSGEPESEWRGTLGLPPSGVPQEGAPDILVVLLDTLRPDHLGCYGYERETSPFLDSWAKDATLFKNVYTHGTQTRIAMASLFTGTLPTVHRVENVELYKKRGLPDISDGLAQSLTTWAETMGYLGYETWGFSSNPHISAEFGFHQGFNRFLETPSKDASVMIDLFLEMLDSPEARTDRPLFAYLHFMDVHNPYEPPKEYRDNFTVPKGKLQYRNGLIDISERDLVWSMSQYDAGICYLDDQLARLLKGWEERSMSHATVVMSDHGDEFLEHGGMGHGTTVYEELARTALIIKAPGLAPGIRSEPLAHIDVHRFVVDLVGGTVPDESQGRPYSEWATTSPTLLTSSRAGFLGLREGQKMLVVSRGEQEEVYWFDRTTDPAELDPRNDPAVLESLIGRLKQIEERDKGVADRLGTPAHAEVPQDAIDQLRSLGYLGGDEE